jgi:PIN domain nuclease of toxin-antitoxin system
MDSPRLTASARNAIESAEQTFVSTASILEIGTKARLGKIEADSDQRVAAIESSGVVKLPVRDVHAAAAARLPLCITTTGSTGSWWRRRSASPCGC